MTNVIEFTNVDEMIEIIETRFKNANVEFNEYTRYEIKTQYENVANKRNIVRIQFDAFHFVIESNLRIAIANHYVNNKFVRATFDNIFAIAIDVTCHHFAIVHIDDNDEIQNVIATIAIDDELRIVELS